MDKKAQISVFLLIGIVILVIIGIFLYQRTQVVKAPEVTAPANVAAVQVYVQQCLEKTGEDGILHNSLQGGYYQNFDMPSIPAVGFYRVPVYFNGLSVSMPTDDKIKSEFELFVRDKLSSCTGGFESVKGHTVAEEGNVSVKSMIIGVNKISVEYDYPLLVDGKTEIRKFTSDYSFRLGKVYDVVQSLMEKSKEEPAFLCLSCYISAGLENNLVFDSLTRGEYYVVIAKDMTTKKPLNFAYAIKLNPPTQT